MARSAKKVTVICTLRNDAKTLDALMSSLLNQTVKPSEIVVVDGGIRSAPAVEVNTGSTTRVTQDIIIGDIDVIGAAEVDTAIVIHNEVVGHGGPVHILKVDALCPLGVDIAVDHRLAQVNRSASFNVLLHINIDTVVAAAVEDVILD